MSSKLLWHHTRNTCTLPQNDGREFLRDTNHILPSFTTLEAGRNDSKADELVVPQDLYPPPN